MQLFASPHEGGFLDAFAAMGPPDPLDVLAIILFIAMVVLVITN